MIAVVQKWETRQGDSCARLRIKVLLKDLKGGASDGEEITIVIVDVQRGVE